jgi:hypothetical protein
MGRTHYRKIVAIDEKSHQQDCGKSGKNIEAAQNTIVPKFYGSFSPELVLKVYSTGSPWKELWNLQYDEHVLSKLFNTL